jgi:two-component system response regulator WspF
MRIAIVNDLMLAVEAIRRVIVRVPEYEVAWIAYDGGEAVEKCGRDKPDLILMDLIMPVMDGVTATSIIMERSPCAILVVTATVSGNASKVFEAMGHGALDAVCTPIFGIDGNLEGGDELLKKIAVIGMLLKYSTTAPKPEKHVATRPEKTQPRMIAIGSSTGGPKALSTILGRLSAPLDAAIVIIQHVDLQFAGGLADWLNDQTSLPVILAREGAQLERDCVYVAGTNDHLVVGGDLALHYTSEPRDYPYRPSVDRFFGTVQQYWPSKGVAVLLTGMGRDGAIGLLALRKAGWPTIAQDEATSVVFGMPKAAIDAGAADAVLPVHNIAEHIRKILTIKEQ